MLAYGGLKVCNHPYLFDEADANNHWTDEAIVKVSY
jgi:hypothetical protein